MNPPFRIVSPVTSDPDLALQLSRGLNAPPFVGRLLVQRGCLNSLDAQVFLEPPESHMGDPWSMKGMEGAVEAVLSWRGTEKKVCVFGDYDLDGISGAALVTLALRRAGGWNLQWALPSRFEDGYGLSDTIIDRLHAEGVSAVIMVDTGVTADKEILHASTLGIQVVVIDHHRPSGDGLPLALAILDPWQPECAYPNKSLSAVGVALKLVQALYQKIDLGGADDFLDLVALGTLSDLMPLETENRYMLHRALSRMASSPIPGIRVLCDGVADSDGRLRSQDVLFRIAPLMNAPGRLDRPDQALRLLLATTEAEAVNILKELKNANEKRRAIESNITAQAVELALKTTETRVLVLHSRGWHLGVLGIVASKLVQMFHKPAAVISVGEDGLSRASVRGIEGFNWHEALQENKDVFVRWGGHASAAGFCVENTMLPDLAEIFEHSAIRQGYLPNANAQSSVETLVEVHLSEVDEDAMAWLRRFEPFGKGNPFPLMLARHVRVVNTVRELRGGHLQFEICHEGMEYWRAVVGFGMGLHAAWLRSNSHDFDIAFEPTWNVYNGKRVLQLQAKAIGRVVES